MSDNLNQSTDVHKPPQPQRSTKAIKILSLLLAIAVFVALALYAKLNEPMGDARFIGTFGFAGAVLPNGEIITDYGYHSAVEALYLCLDREGNYTLYRQHEFSAFGTFTTYNDYALTLTPEDGGEPFSGVLADNAYEAGVPRENEYGNNYAVINDNVNNDVVFLVLNAGTDIGEEAPISKDVILPFVRLDDIPGYISVPGIEDRE